MKKIILFTLLCKVFLLNAQTDLENYIQTRTYLEPVVNSNSNAKQFNTIKYYDGLGKVRQIINVKSSPTGKDLVTPVTYDQFGRQSKDILPTPVNTLNSAIHSGVTNESTANSYYGTNYAYAEKEFESSPLDRILQQGFPGDAWRVISGHTQKYGYDANSSGEVLKFIANSSWNNVNNVSNTINTLSVSTENTLQSSGGYYNTGMLYKRTITDEDDKPVTLFINGNNQTVLIRKTDGGQNIDTYYVYNEYNQKTFVIPPKAVKNIKENGNIISPSVLEDLCYQYSYDEKNRVVEKKLPGKDWEYIVYDKQDRAVLTQDAILRGTNNNFLNRGWIFTKYDEFGRELYTGFFADSSSRQVMQNELNNIVVNASNNEKRAATPFGSQGINVYYDKQAFPTGNMTLLTVNYYDSYPADAPAVPSTVLGQNILVTRQNDLLTTTYVKNIEGDYWTKSYYYYDIKGQIVSTKTNNYLGGYTNNDFKLDFKGQVEEKYTFHRRTISDSEVKVKERFIYDNQNRLLKQYHQVDNLQEELLSENTYNEIGQLINKKTGNNSGIPLQSIDYTYNIRGWLTSINNPNNATSFNNKLFGMELRYESPLSTAFTQANYNGNISEFDWKTTNGNLLRRYAYKYDKLDRLTDASYLEPFATVPVTNGYGEFLTYDENGNIRTLKRYQSYNNTAMMIDDLDYTTYKGNQLKNVTDNSNNNLGYLTGGNTISYDSNGNMIDHIDKGISSISYNFLNLPQQITLQSSLSFGTGIAFSYRADGVKLKKAYSYKNPRSGFVLTENTDYLDGFQYFGLTGFISLQFFPTSEGYYDYQKKRYVYNYSDVWGNIRLAYYNSNNIATIDREANYYPFGLEYQGYNGTFTQQQNYTYGFQGQETQKETGWDSFRWRNSIPELGRFFNIDPLAEKYFYNSPFAFQENKIGKGKELEGLELVPFEFLLISNSSVKPTIPIVEQIREMPIEPVTLTAKATPPPQQLNLWQRIGNFFRNIEIFSKNDKAADVVKPENVSGSEKNPYLDKALDELERAKSSYEDLIKEHEEKLKEFEKDPIGNTSPEKLAEMKKGNPTPEQLLQRAQGRIKALEKQLNKQRGELEKINNEIQRR
ncbi:DUF6443 domain-containing protein [Chryseobacterium nepalense]|uniref:DUF6443 domain-containing protein n=1 Tax=Chryseobacterium nepalense TaxID=1854498 RepID=UPI002DFFC59B|nr:RHS repeat-associated protein [Chryseobacterium nepalense]